MLLVLGKQLWGTIVARYYDVTVGRHTKAMSAGLNPTNDFSSEIDFDYAFTHIYPEATLIQAYIICHTDVSPLSYEVALWSEDLDTPACAICYINEAIRVRFYAVG
jgi:hypothetical protein